MSIFGAIYKFFDDLAESYLLRQDLKDLMNRRDLM